MARSIWRGAISFGLVNVPVKLYSAVSKKSVRFNQLHEKDNSRIQMKRFCADEDEEVPYEEIVKGYEISPGRYVVITPEELEGLDPKKTRTIDIEDFVDLDEIDPLYYEHPYYLAPDTGAAKPYKLLLEALKETNKVAIARVVIRSKEYLTAIRPAGDGDVLTMETMLFADELIDPGDLDELPDQDVRATEREVDMARQLIESLATGFEPGKYRDEYRERVLELIEQKASGQEITVTAEPEEPAVVPDLMAALEASLAAAQGGKQKLQAQGRPPPRRRTGRGRVRRTAPRRPQRRSRLRRRHLPRSPPRNAPPPRSPGPRRALDAGRQGESRRGGGRGPPPQAVQPRQGLLSGHRVHQGPGDRLLPPGVAGAAAAPTRPAPDAEALSRRRRGPVLLREAGPSHEPDWIQTVTVQNKRRDRLLLANDLPTLIWLANLADLELHTMLSLAKDVMRPTMMVFDLDPGEPATIVECAQVGLALRELFKGLGLDSYPKTSGSKGLQIYVPLNTPVTYDDTKPFAHAIAKLLEKQMPELVVSSMKKSIRGGKVLVDWSQNDDHKTTVCVYSLRARERPTVFDAGPLGGGPRGARHGHRRAARVRGGRRAGAG